MQNLEFDFYCIPINITSLLTSFDGIRLGIHLRLTKNLSESLRTKPILFLGEMTVAQINQINPIGQFLFSKGVMYVDYSLQAINEFSTRHLNELKHGKITLDFIVNELHDWIRVSPPPHLDSSHAITNEWGVYRLADSILMNDNLRSKLDELFQRNNISNSLYFKSLILQNEHQFFNKDKRRIDPKIGGIENKTIVYIDDEYQKGWELVLKDIFDKSGAKLFTFKGFDKSQPKESLIYIIINWLQSEADDSSSDKLLTDADLFIIDLRLHDNDFGIIDFDQLTGFQLVKALKFGIRNSEFRGNLGRQIVIFTASNKVWNMKIAEDMGVSAFLIKEAPVFFSSREDTKSLYFNFARKIKEAANKSYLANLIKLNNSLKANFHHINSEIDEIQNFKDCLCSKGGWLDQYVELLLIDDVKTINQVILILFQVFENYCNLRNVFIYEPNRNAEGLSAKVLKDNEIINVIVTENGKNFSKIKFNYGKFSFQKKDSQDTIISVSIGSENKLFSNKLDKVDISFIFRIAAVLHYTFGIDDKTINQIIELRFIRSNLAAHTTGKLDLGKRSFNRDDIIFLVNLLEKMFTV